MVPAAGGSEVAVASGGPAPEPVLAGGSDEATALRGQGEVVGVAVLFAVLTVALGIVPSPLFRVVRDVGASFGLF